MNIINEGHMDDSIDETFKVDVEHNGIKYFGAVTGRKLSEFNTGFYYQVNIKDIANTIEINGTYAPDKDNYIWEGIPTQLPQEVVNKIGEAIKAHYSKG